MLHINERKTPDLHIRFRGTRADWMRREAAAQDLKVSALLERVVDFYRESHRTIKKGDE